MAPYARRLLRQPQNVAVFHPHGIVKRAAVRRIGIADAASLAAVQRIAYFRTPAVVFHGHRVGKVIKVHASVRMDERYAQSFLREPRKRFLFLCPLVVGKDARKYAPVGSQIVHDAVLNMP